MARKTEIQDLASAIRQEAVSASFCCEFHESGGTVELWCGGDTANSAGRHSTVCAYHAGGDCTCMSPEQETEADWDAR